MNDRQPTRKKAQTLYLPMTQRSVYKLNADFRPYPNMWFLVEYAGASKQYLNFDVTYVIRSLQ